MKKSRQQQKTGIGTFASAFLISMVWGTTVLAQATAPVGDPDTAVKLQIEDPKNKSLTVEVYRKMSHGNLEISTPDAEKTSEQIYLRPVVEGALLNVDRPYVLSADAKKIKPLPVPEELKTLPGLLAPVRKNTPLEMRFHVNKPVRVYAHIDFTTAEQPQPEKAQWMPYLREPQHGTPLYYRDFPAGDNTMHFSGGTFIGMGIRALDQLTPAERVTAYIDISGNVPILKVRNDFEDARSWVARYAWVNPNDGLTAATGEIAIDHAPHAVKSIELPGKGAVDGILYSIEVTLRNPKGEVVREITSPFGRFPAPVHDAAVTEPFFPYGGYMKINICSDEDFNRLALRATLFQMRKLGMNSVVLDFSDRNMRTLDLLKEFGMKGVVRMAGKQGDIRPVPDEVMAHPAILTYMAGDEPKIKEIDKYIKAYEQLAKQYPNFKAVTCTIFDGWGTGCDTDPVRVFKDYLGKFPVKIYGRYYPFRKQEFGLLSGPAYRGSGNPRTVLRQVNALAGANGWWLAPQFFGHDSDLPYWRIPTNEETLGLLHLAMAYRCSGVLGWALHSFKPRKAPEGDPAFSKYRTPYVIESIGFDGVTMAPARFQRHKALGEIGEFIKKAKPVLLSMTPFQQQITHCSPYEIEATAHWTSDGKIALYLVNLDTQNAHPANIKLFAGSTKMPKRYGEGVDSQLVALKDVATGKPIPFEKEEDKGGNLHVVVKVPQLQPGEGRLFLTEATGPNGAYDKKAFPKGLLELEQDIELGGE